MGGMVFAFLGAVVKSKCSHVECCGMAIDRDIQAELVAERLSRQNNNPVASPTLSRNTSNNPPFSEASPTLNIV